jgi:hypothetical protein
MAAHGVIARLDEPLTIYRMHAANTFRLHETRMTVNAIKVLVPAYERIFGSGAEAAASAIVWHLSVGMPVPDEAALRHLADVFERLTGVFLDRTAPGEDSGAIVVHAQSLWRRMLRSSARAGGVSATALLAARPLGFKPSAEDYARIILRGIKLPPRPHGATVAAPSPQAAPRAGRLFDTAYRPVPADPALPPTLFVVVDTEAEFDWSRPFAHNLTHISAMECIEHGQEVFDRYGLRPIYVVDFPVASQAGGYQKLRRILQRDGCVIGAHLHPWTTPPFEEDLSSRNSYPGNLPPALEEQKLICIIETIRESFGVTPEFYKAGRYGFGPATAASLARHGIKVDLSVLPGADLRRKGGPDFRGLRPEPYMIDGYGLLSVPMTRAEIGVLPSPRLARLARLPLAEKLHAPALLARLRIDETVTLTPEGVTAAEQIRLIKTLLQRGERIFVLHYHSPSLTPGHTPYVRNAAEARGFVENIETVCRFFLEDLGGMPGNPRDLLDLRARLVCKEASPGAHPCTKLGP